MKNRFEISPTFTTAPERTAWYSKTVPAKVYKLNPERAAFIAAILAGARPERTERGVNRLKTRADKE
ncbi:MAG: hypothetical protein ACREDD_01170 [Methylocella sp.]